MNSKKTYLIIRKLQLIFIFTTISSGLTLAQFPWPVTPFNQSQDITGTFCEFRDTGTSDHFHNGTDIPKADGSPVYPVKNGTVSYIDPSGTSAYVRVGDIAYVHIKPNPSLSVGDYVTTSQTVLGTILSGQGHLHLTNGYVGSEKNSMLGDGLTPLEDPWPPIIRYIRFYANLTTNQFPSNKLSGLVDIVVKVDEQNGPPSSSVSRLNNGTFKIGYKILSADKSTIIYEPPNNGLRFSFRTKPSNSCVHRVFFDQLSSTTSHVYVVTNDLTRDNYWDTTTIPADNYVVMVFTEDTQHNTDTMYVNVEATSEDIIPPGVPVYKFVGKDEYPMELKWYPNPDDDLVGYRLYYSYDNEKWNLRLTEDKLGKAQVDTGFNTTVSQDIYFKLTAVDNAPIPNESLASDVYGVCNNEVGEKILIVDGFDRFETSGSWKEPNHFFVFTHGQAVAANGYNFDSASNDAIIDSSVDLKNYQAVIWILGDESIADETFSQAEQVLLKAYLENGGRLFVNGSEIAWDLDQDSDAYGTTPEDEQFFHEYLKADYAGDDSGLLSVFGVEGTIFDGLQFDFGIEPYLEDFPDYIIPYDNNTVVNLKYSETKNAGIQYNGYFGNGTKAGKLVYLAFPFETIGGEDTRNTVMGRILKFFFSFIPVSDEPGESSEIPIKFALLQNYPNPFNPHTFIEYHLPVTAHITVKIYNLLGQTVRTLVDKIEYPGKYQKGWDGLTNKNRQVVSGIYLIRMIAKPIGNSKVQNYIKTQRVMLLR